MESISATENKDFATASIKRLIIKFGIPGAVGMLMAGIQTIIDGLFIGRYVGADALAAVNIVMPSYSTIIAVCVVVGIGSLTVIGMSQGAGNIQRANNAFRSSFVFLLLFSILSALLFIAFAKPLASIMGANDALLPNAITYLTTLSIFIPTIAITFMGDYFFRAIGKPIHGLILIATTVILNIILDYVLIAHYSLGVMGAALATGLSFAATAVFALWLILKTEDPISLKKGRFSWRLIGRMTYNGSSEGVSEISAGITQLVFNIAMMKYIGSSGVAAFATVNYIMITAILIFVGVSNGLVPVISYAYGAGNHERLKLVVRANIITNSVLGVVAFMVLFFSAKHIISPFFEGSDASAIAIAVAGAKIVAVAMLFSGANIAISSMFTAIGDALSSVVVSALRGLVLITIGVYTLPLFLEIDGVWLAIPFAEITTIIVAIVMLRKKFSYVK